MSHLHQHRPCCKVHAQPRPVWLSAVHKCFCAHLRQCLLARALCACSDLSSRGRGQSQTECRIRQFRAMPAGLRCNRCVFCKVQYLMTAGKGCFTSNIADLLSPATCDISNACNVSTLVDALNYVDISIYADDGKRLPRWLSCYLSSSRCNCKTILGPICVVT